MSDSPTFVAILNDKPLPRYVVRWDRDDGTSIFFGSDDDKAYWQIDGPKWIVTENES